MSTLQPNASITEYISDELVKDEKSFEARFALNMLISLSTISYCIWDDRDKKYVGLVNYPIKNNQEDTLKHILDNDSWLKKKYKSITVGIYTTISTLIPEDHFNEKSLGHYLDFNFSNLTTSKYLFQAETIQGLKSKNIYAIEKKLVDLVKKSFPNAVIKDSNSSFLTFVLQESVKLDNAVVYINIVKNTLQIAITKNGTLQIHNHFHFTNNEELIYDLLYVLDQFEIDKEWTTVHLFGDIQKEDTLYTQINKYISKLYLGRKPTDKKFGFKISMLPSHQYCNLFTL